MNEKLKTEQMQLLMKAILNLETEEDCFSFFDDLCTVSELTSFAQRFEVARMLKDGCQYAEIVAKTGASSATISRVNRALLYGEDGYKKAIEKLEG